MEEGLIRSLAEFLSEPLTDAELSVLEWREDGANTVRCKIATSDAWWERDPGRSVGEGRLEITCRGVVAGRIALGEERLDTEDLAATTSDVLVQLVGARAVVYGNAPVEDPYVLLAELSDWLTERNAPFGLEQYLDGRAMSVVAAQMKESSYFLIKCPAILAQAACDALRRRSVPFFLRGGASDADKQLVAVRVGASWLVCVEAVVQVSTVAG